MNLRKAARDPWVWGQLALLLVVGLGAPVVPRFNLGWADPILGMMDPARVRWLGALAGAAGLAEVLWGFRSLGRSLTPGVEPLPDGELVRSGAYARVRHPIYLGLILTLAGYTLWWSNWRLGLIAGWGAGLFFEGKAKAEEKHMAERFKEYDEYRRRVPRLFPWGGR